MNLYNKLYILEYTSNPIEIGFSKLWYLNLSKKKYYYYHREFDLYAYVNPSYKFWYRLNKFNRLIGYNYLHRRHNGQK